MTNSLPANDIPTPLATVKGQAIIDLPKDLYIPPDAMRVLLEAFEGPLDFLLYLIRKQNIDILDIPIASVTQQYMEYIDLMQELSLELAAEYLVMAAMLAEIKSRMLLPQVVDPENQEEDPRAELIRRLQEYECYKKAAEDLDKLPRQDRDFFMVTAESDHLSFPKPLPHVTMKELALALLGVLKRASLHTSHQISLEVLTVREKMAYLIECTEGKTHVPFHHLFRFEEGRLGVVVTFLALLELLKQHLLEFIQASPFAPIYLQQAKIQNSEKIE